MTPSQPLCTLVTRVAIACLNHTTLSLIPTVVSQTKQLIHWCVAGPGHPAGVDLPERVAGRRDRMRKDSSVPTSSSARDHEVAGHHSKPQTELSSCTDTGSWPRARLPDSGLY